MGYIPKVRFRGFADDWTQYKCKDIFDKVGIPVETKDEETYREIGIRSHGKGIFYKDAVTGKDIGNKRVFWIEPDCFIVNIVFAWERAVARTTEKEQGMIASHRFPMYKPKTNVVDLDFITKFFTTDKGKNILEAASPGGAGRNKTLGQKEFSDSKLWLASYNEQQKIGKLIDMLDGAITLHQRKCDETKELKKYMLQKMFPKNGETKPEIRFPGFTDDWEQRKFSDFTWNAGKRNKDDLDLEPYAITNEHGFIRQSEAHDDFGYMKDTDRKAYNIVMPNSFAYNPARINVGSIGYYEGAENVIVSSLYEVFQTADYVDDRFLWHWFKSEEFPRWIERLQEGSVRLYFYYDKLCECQMLMPSVPEQRKIANALDALDNLITIHQRKLDCLKEIKRFLLQNMF